jgi:hypothetical protein
MKCRSSGQTRCPDPLEPNHSPSLELCARLPPPGPARPRRLLAPRTPGPFPPLSPARRQPDLLGWRPVFDSWLAALPAAITSEDREELSQLAAWLLPPCLRMAAKGCPQVGGEDGNEPCIHGWGHGATITSLSIRRSRGHWHWLELWQQCLARCIVLACLASQTSAEGR